MGTYAISSANLNIIEDNLDSVARELSGVITNVNTVNEQVDGIEEKITNLDSEIKDLVKEIRETAFTTNARQNIMYNNEQIEKKYGYYNDVRRVSYGLIESIDTSYIDKDILINKMQKLLLNNPSYWLTNAYAALVSWITNDKQTCEIELNNALSKNKIKTELFFLFINLKYNRLDVAYRWLEAYLNDLNPLKLDQSFIEILELCANDLFGLKGKTIIIDKINIWMNILSNNIDIDEKEENKWIKYIDTKEQRDLMTIYLDTYSHDKNVINDNLFISSTYSKILDELKTLSKTNNQKSNLNDIIKKVIFDYEEEEKEFIDDNFKNKLIIEQNGNKTKAQKIYEEQKSIYEGSTNIVSLLNNIIIYGDRYNISESTRKLVLTYSKKYICKAYNRINEYLLDKDIVTNVDDFNYIFKKDTSMNDIEEKINYYVNGKYIKDDRTLWIAFLLLIDLISIIGVFFLSSNIILCLVIVILTFLGNGFIIFKTIKTNNDINKIKQIKKGELYSLYEKMYAEYKDYSEIINNNKERYSELTDFLDGLKINNYMYSTERNIDIG